MDLGIVAALGFTAAFLMSEKMITVAWDENATGDAEKKAIVDFIHLSEGVEDEALVILEVDDELKLLHAKIEKVETLLGLRRLEEVVALDVYYEIFTKEEVEQATREIQMQVPGGSSRGQNASGFFANHHIDAAWSAGLSGVGLEIGVIDNGPDHNDPVWGQGGNPHGTNPQPNRSVNKKGRYKSAWWNPWASYDGYYNHNSSNRHGSDMLQIIGNPSGESFEGVDHGVAYRADIRSVRAGWGVVIDFPGIVLGVTRSYKYLKNKDDVKIISMSMGGIVSWTCIERAIKKCYNKGKMIVTGAGTLPQAALVTQLLSISPAAYTIFPGRMKPYTVAATGIKETNDILSAEWCNWCFGKADFVVEFDPNDNGSSSEATALTSSMAALIWAREPFLSRSDVLAKMQAAADLPITPNDSFGYGRINMQTYLTNEGI